MCLQPPEWKPSCCLHFLPLTATYCLLLVLAVWLAKHRGAGRALLDITPMGTHWLTLLGSWQTQLFIFHFFFFFFLPRLVHGSARLLLGQKKNRKGPVERSRRRIGGAHKLSCTTWPWVERAVSKSTRGWVCENIQTVSAVCAFPFFPVVFSLLAVARRLSSRRSRPVPGQCHRMSSSVFHKPKALSRFRAPKLSEPNSFDV